MNHPLGSRPLASAMLRAACTIITALSLLQALNGGDKWEAVRTAVFVLIVFLIGLADTTVAYLSDDEIFPSKLGRICLLICVMAQFWAIVAGFFIIGASVEQPEWLKISVYAASGVVGLAVIVEAFYYLLCNVYFKKLPRGSSRNTEAYCKPCKSLQAKP